MSTASYASDRQQVFGLFEPPMTIPNRQADFFHSTTGRIMFFAATIIVLLFFALSYV